MKRINMGADGFKLDFPIRGGTAFVYRHENGGGAELVVELPYNAAYGMGEKYDHFNQKGRFAVNRVEEKFCHQGDKTYCPAPFFLTDTGFGLYVEADSVTKFKFGEKITVSMPRDADVVLFEGTPEKIISEYMSLFGPAKLPPRWAFGPWVSANHWDTQEKAEAQIEALRKFRFPATVIVLEAWSDEATFYIFNGAKYAPVKGNEALSCSDFDFSKSPWPDPCGLIGDLHGSGLHLVLWQIPVYKKQKPGDNRQNDNDRAYAADHGLCVFTDKGEPYRIPEGRWFAGSMIPDFTNPETKRLFFAKRRYLLEMGVDGFKTDGGEFIYSDALRFHDGSDGARMKNRYAQSYTEAYTEFIGENHVLLSRAGYAGQHMTPVHWAGDQQSENGELKSVLRAGLSAAMTGIPFWGFDIAGFSGPLPSPDLYRRATQMACFCPLMQWHSEPDGGQFHELMPSVEGNNERSPWNIAAVNKAPEFVDEMRFWHNLRMNLLPYLYCTALECVSESRPMMRPLAYDFYGDPAVRDIDDQFMLGESLLVAPMLEENAQRRRTYLPHGTWYDLFTGKKSTGGQIVNAGSKSRLPVYLRAGHGVALNLGAVKKLGSDVGNRVDSYCNLVFLLAGDEGSCHFKDDLGNDFTLRWEKSDIKKTGHSSCAYSAKIIG